MSDPKIKYDIEAAVKGEASVEQLAQALRGLGDTLDGDLKTQASAAADALQKLGAKQSAVDNFARLRRETADLAQSLDGAAARVDELGKELPQAAAATQQFAAAENSARQALNSANGDMQAAKARLRELRDETQGAARRTVEYREAVAQQSASVQALAKDLTHKRQELQTAATATKTAERAEKALNTEYQNSVNAARGVSVQLGERNRALEASRGTMQTLGIATTNLAQTERDLQGAVAAVRAEVQALPGAHRAATDAAKQQADAMAATAAAAKQQAAAMETAAAAHQSELQSVKAKLGLEQSQIAVRRQVLSMEADHQQALLQTARARQDEAQAMQAESRLRQIEADQLRLVAQGKRAEAVAIQANLDARRQQLATLGPLTQAQQLELRALENSAKALRVQAAASAQAADRTAVHTATTKASALAVGEFNRAGNGATDILRQLAPLMASAFSAQQFVGTITAQESVARGFELIFGSAQQAAAEMQFIRETSNKLGLENLNLARSYQSLAASTKGTALEGKATRDVFEAVARAMSTLGKSSADTDRALTAISQIASKGTASMEELRGQLGEALPGAMKAAADGAGITVEQLVEMVSSGSVLATDILPALTVGLNDLYGKAAPPQTLVAEWARLKNVLSDLTDELAKAGASDALKWMAEQTSRGLLGLWDATKLAGRGIGEFAAAVTTGNSALYTFDENMNMAADRQRKFMKDTEAATSAQVAQVAAQQASNSSTQESLRTQEAQAEKAQQAGASLLQLKARYAELAEGAKQYTVQMVKEGQAREAEGVAMTRLVGVYGSEIERRQTAAQVADIQAQSATRLAQAKDAEAIISQSLALKLQEEALKRNDNTEATRKEAERAGQSAQVKRAEADQSSALARAKVVEAEAAKAAAEAYKDNAAKVGELRGAAESAAREVDRLTKLQQAGAASDDQVAQARARAAGATMLYRDALGDATAAAERRQAAERQTADLVQSGISVEYERVKALQEVADAYGDSAKSSALAQQATGLQAKAAEQSATAARQEALAIRETADAKERELRATGELTAGKKAEIDAQRRSADLKDLEAQKADILAQKIRQLAASDHTRTDALERQIAAQEKQLDLIERQDALERKRAGVDKDGFATAKDGQRLVMGNDLGTRTGIAAFLKAAGVDDDAKAREIANEFADSNGDIPYINNGAQIKYGGRSSTISQAVLKAAEQYTFGKKGDSGKTPSTIPEPNSVRNVTVNLNNGDGRNYSVPTTQQGADILESFMRQLADAKSRS